MTDALPHVLSKPPGRPPDFRFLDAAAAVAAARFWSDNPKNAPTRKDVAIEFVTGVMDHRGAAAQRLTHLLPDERELLAVFRRYGGSLSGTVLRLEMLARGFIEADADDRGRLARPTPYQSLRNKLIVYPSNAMHSSSYYSHFNRYPDSTTHPSLVRLVEPAGPPDWKPSCSATEPRSVTRRPMAELVLDLWAVAQMLAKEGTFKTKRGGGLPKALQNKVKKVLPPSAGDPPVPDPEALLYEILRGIGAITSPEEEFDDRAKLDLRFVQRKLEAGIDEVAWTIARGWIASKFWNDGVGATPGKEAETYGLAEPASMREILAWGLGVVAADADGWFDLKAWLVALFAMRGRQMFLYYSEAMAWNPGIGLTHDATWGANAVFVTLVYLGLAERGPTTPGGPLAFRLTPLGRGVFGAPEVPPPPAPTAVQFLTIMPNYEIVAQLETAPPSAILPLARIARRTSPPGSPMPTFALERATVYAALESGMTIEQVSEFLTAHSRTGVPANVARELLEWGGKRESMVLRSRVALQLKADGSFAVQPFKTREPSKTVVRRYPEVAVGCWEADEDGFVIVRDAADAVALARLGQFADPAGSDFRLTPASVARAKRSGWTVEQIIGRLHQIGSMPPLLDVMIKNWHTGGKVLLDQPLVLHVPDAKIAAAIEASARFQPYIIRHVGDGWFVMEAKHRKDIEKLLKAIGFAWDVLPKPGA